MQDWVDVVLVRAGRGREASGSHTNPTKFDLVHLI